jgi:methionyl-tRNA formyltransferase
MRIVLIGQAAFGAKVLQSLVDNGEQVVGVYSPPETTGKADPLKQLAAQLGIPSFQQVTMRSAEVYKQYSILQPELNIMAFVTSIIPGKVLNYPVLGTIQYHPSLLPRHRGGSAINWAIINGESSTGISIFWPDAGIDTGPILLQKKVEITLNDTLGTLYFNKLFPLGVAAIIESIELIRKGIAPRIPQDEAHATYEGLCTDSNTLINWEQPARVIYNLVRGSDPQPGASTWHGSLKLKLFSAKLLTGNYGGIPGEIVELNDSGFIIAAKEGAILINHIRPEGSVKIAASDYAKQAGLQIGSRLGNRQGKSPLTPFMAHSL